MPYSLLAWLAAILAVSYALRTGLVRTFGRRAPRLAAFVDRAWPWTPFAAALLLLLSAQPAFAVVAVPVTLFQITRRRLWSISAPPGPRR